MTPTSDIGFTRRIEFFDGLGDFHKPMVRVSTNNFTHSLLVQVRGDTNQGLEANVL